MTKLFIHLQTQDKKYIGDQALTLELFFLAAIFIEEQIISKALK